MKVSICVCRFSYTVEVSIERLQTQIYRDLHIISHEPNHVKRGIVRCVYQRPRIVTNMNERSWRKPCFSGQHCANALI